MGTVIPDCKAAHRPCFGASSAPVIPSARYPCTTPVVGIYLPLALLTSLALAYLPFTVSMGLILSLVYIAYLTYKEEGVSSRVQMRFLWVSCGTLSLGERVPFRSLLYKLLYGIVYLGLKICMRGIRGFFEPACPFPMPLVRGLIWFGLVGFCIPLFGWRGESCPESGGWR